MALEKIVSGGQTGVDRAALDAALDLGIACGGWCPRGRLAEDGTVPNIYPLTETKSSQYHVRTRQNVRDSDATLIIHIGPLEGGSALTAKFASEYGRPCMLVDLDKEGDAESLLIWLKNNEITVLNIAGPRASKMPDLYYKAYKFLKKLLPLATKESTL